MVRRGTIQSLKNGSRGFWRPEKSRAGLDEYTFRGLKEGRCDDFEIRQFRAEARGGQRLDRGRRLIAAHQQIEIGKLAQRYIAKRKLGERRALERDRFDALALEQSDKPDKFAHRDPIAQQVALVMGAQFAHHGLGRLTGAIGGERAVERRHHALGQRKIDHAAPIEVGSQPPARPLIAGPARTSG
jgi:hypothetical protein